VARLSLLVEVETLRGIVTPGANPERPGKVAAAPAPHEPITHVENDQATHDDSAAANIAAIARSYTCKYCAAPGLTAAELMTHGRRHARHGTCPGEAIHTSA
jgi:hypothetical protein